MAENITISNDYGQAVVSPGAGAALRSLQVVAGAGRHELLHGGDGALDPAKLPQGTGSFLMAPWPNRIRDGRLPAKDGEHRLPVNSGVHAIHGLVREREWRVPARTASSVRMEIDLAAPWPYRGSVVSEVALEWNSLVQTLTVTSQDRECPAGFGWHPWFRRTLAPGSGQVSLHADAEAMWVLDSTITPTGETVKGEAVEQLWRGVQLAAGAIDGCFRMLQGNSAELTWPEVRLEMSSSANVSHLMVYTPKDGTALCVEPQTCAVNAFQLAKSGVPRTGAASARPDAPLTGWTRWTWR